LGVVMVYSASVALPDNPKFANYSQLYFLQRHLLALAIGFVVALAVVQVPTAFWEKQAPAIFVVALMLLVLVLVPFIGKVVNFSRRWIPLGFMNFQPSELAKLAIAMYAANYMLRRMDTRERFFRAVTPMVGGRGLRRRAADAPARHGRLHRGGHDRDGHPLPGRCQRAHVLPDGGGDRGHGVAVPVLRRPAPRAHPGLPGPLEPQVRAGQGLPADAFADRLGRGEIFGQGLGSSVEKLHYLPEAHTDFLLAVIGEELGFVGVATVVLCSSG
jgi:cell division protein FtsW